MLMQPVAAVQPGSAVELQLQFADGSTLPVDFVARPANALDDGQDHAAHSPGKPE
jgi:copper(I)-binding protein